MNFEEFLTAIINAFAVDAVKEALFLAVTSAFVYFAKKNHAQNGKNILKKIFLVDSTRNAPILTLKFVRNSLT